MLLRFVVYWGLGIDAVVKGQYITAVLCFGTPLGGPIGMWTAILAGLIFAIRGFYVESGFAIGLVIFNLVGNRLWPKEVA